MRKSLKRVLATVLSVLMLVSIVPMTAFAAEADVAQTALTDVTANYQSYVGLNVIEDNESTLAPGVKLNEIVAFDKNGKRVEMYVTTVDTTVDTVQIYANYKDNQCKDWGLQTLSEQVAAIEKNHAEPFTVVAGINASYYNTTTGKPTGAFVMEGVDVTTESEGNNFAFFAVLKDGTYMIGNKGEYSQYKGKIKEAIGGYVHIVKDGAVVSGLDKTTKYPRQTIGLTKDGKVILMTADGSQTQTVGLTYQEQAEVMLAMGCEDALHLDGGNSGTFGGVREGTKEFVLINSPSGLAERAVSNTLCIVSTAVADGTFDRAAIYGDYDYFVPNSTYTFTAKGIDASGGPANEIPADVKWTLSDSSFGTITDGKFVSNGKLGDVAIQMVQGDKVVGSKTIHVVNPTSIKFDAEDKTIPYSKSAPIEVTAMYNLNEIYSVAADYDFAIANANAGSISGFTFTATKDESIKNTTVTATYKYAAGITDTVTITFGKGSEVLFDFEDGDISDWHGTETIFEWIDNKNAENPDAKYPVSEPLNGYSNGIVKQTSSVFLATAENGGKVKNGNYSLGFTMDHRNVTDIGGWLYNYLYYTGETKVLRDVANGMNGIRIGMWVYVPDVTNVAWRIVRSTTTTAGKTGITYKYMKSAYDKANVSYATNYGVPEAGWVYMYYDLTDLADNIKQTTSLYDPDNNHGVAFGTSGGNYYPAFLQLFTGSATDTPRTMTYYIDDITIDYSDVTDDRDAPVVSDLKVSADIDNFVAINGQTLYNNTLSFSANVAEVEKNNSTGLDYSTAKIYVDGVDMSGSSAFKATAGVLTLTDVNLADGQHKISFEIADKQGNYTMMSKTFTVDGTADSAKVSLVGRNDSNATPKAGSVYYLDIKAADASQISSVTTTIQLDLTNKFEYENIICAPGVKAEAKLDKNANKLIVTITNNGTYTGEQVLASIPVRVWAWDEAATGVTADNQFATKAIPTINIEVEAVGSVVYKSGNFIGGFYGALNVKTELDNSTAWHKHTAAAVADKAATCTEEGFEGRTYCDGCKSVIDWGNTVAATGHKYAIVDGKYVCATCNTAENYTGLVEIDGKTYYIVTGNAQKGWQIVDGEWYYFDSTFAGLNGEHAFAPVTYSFTNGKIDSGVWAKTLFGSKYYYGPSCYKNGWAEIDGNKYYFENDLRLEGGWQLTYDISVDLTWFYFDENGVYDPTMTIADGFYTDRKGYAYAKDGAALVGLHQIGDDYYYFDYKGYAVKSGTHAGRLFKDDYAAFTGLLEKNGETYYYEDGRTGPYGLVKLDDEYYYSYWGGVIKTSGTYYVDTTNCDLPAGEYTFDENGHLVSGIVNIDGVDYLFANGKKAQEGLYNIDGAYYCADWNGALKADGRFYAGTTHCDLPVGNYTFGADGKMLNGPVEVNGTKYLYVNGTTATCGLYEIDGDYYYSWWGGVLKTDGRYYVDTTFCDLPKNNNYTFGKDGKMLNGVVNVDGVDFLYINGTTATCGLFEVDGDYYYSWWGGVLKKDGRFYVDTTFCDLPKNNNYTFGKDGKMLNGPVEIDGTKYLYLNGSTANCGLYNIDGDYYYSWWGGVLKTDGRFFVDKSYCDLSIGNYEFDADGKMLNGIVEKDGKMYYYVNGTTATNGLTKIGDDYYFVNWGGEIMTSGKYYVDTTRCDLPVGHYIVGADGKLVDGFVTEADGIHYYENGKPGKLGLNYVDGYYYFVKNGEGLLVTNQKYYVWETNGYCYENNYKFDALGRITGM